MPGEVPYWGAGGVLDTVADALFNEPLVLLGEDGAPFFEPGRAVSYLLDGPAWVNNHIHVLRPHPGVDRRFLVYALNSVDYAAYITGSTRDKLTQDEMWQIRVPAVPEARQRAIADYLDRETARIDALIVAKQRMVTLLEERWQAFLDEVLWTNVDRLTRVMHVVDLARQVMYGIVLPGPDVGGDGVAIVKGGDVAQRRLSWEELCKTTNEIEAPFARARLRGGDLVFAIRGGIGDVAIVPDALAGANITQDVARVAPRSGISSTWLLYSLESPKTQSDVRSRVTGATITGLNIWELERVQIPLASEERQQRDVSRLDQEHREVGAMRGALARQVVLLRERRQALITAAVTGQLDISETA
jgi:type I restriction enzyme S subunit